MNIIENNDETEAKSDIIETYLMFDGTEKNIKDLQIGDQLMGIDSLPCTILNKFKSTETAYFVNPVKGNRYIVGESDILSLTYSRNPIITWRIDRKDYTVTYFNKNLLKNTTKTFSVKNYKTKEKAFQAAEIYKNNIVVDNNFNINVKKFLKSSKSLIRDSKAYKIGINFSHAEFLFDPYIIGLWLGDGTTASTNITSADKEIVDYIREYFKKFNLVVKTKGMEHYIGSGKKGRNYPGKNLFLEFLQVKKLLNNKHIPIEFLHTSKGNRLRLLAGLLDSDGYLDDGNCYDFIQKSEKLFDGFIYLCRSLGFSCYKTPCVKVCTNGKNGPVAGNYFRCCVSGEGLEEIPVLLERKKASERKQIKRANITGIKLEEIGKLAVYKLITDKPNFLMSDFTVKHMML